MSDEEVFVIRYLQGNVPGEMWKRGMKYAVGLALILCDQGANVLGIFTPGGDQVVSASRIADLYAEHLSVQTKGLSL
jgi:hypothetical protein